MTKLLDLGSTITKLHNTDDCNFFTLNSLKLNFFSLALTNNLSRYMRLVISCGSLA